MRVLILTAFVTLSVVLPAQAARIDITDQALLGTVLASIDVQEGGGDYNKIITEVRFDSGIYSYIYAVQGSPYFPSAFGLDEGEAHMLNFAVQGPFSSAQTWGAIYDPASRFRPNPIDIAPQPGGFIAIPQFPISTAFAVVYWQSPLRPAFNGTLTYTGHNYCYSEPFCYDDGVYNDGGHNRLYDVGSFNETVFAPVSPVPEPASIVMLAAGLVGLAQTVRRRRKRLSSPSA